MALVTDSDLIGTREAADILGVTQRTVKRLAKLHTLPSVHKMAGNTSAYLFERDEVERLRDERSRNDEAS